MNTEQLRAELLPCPFCGSGTTEIQENGRPWLGTRWGDPVSVSVRHWCDHVDGQPSRMIERVGRDRAAAIDAWNRRADLKSQVKNDKTLFCDLKTDEEKSAFFLSGRGYETGVIAPSIQNDVAMAYHRCAEYKKKLEALQSQPSHAGWKEAAIAWEVCASLHREFCKGRDPFFKTRQADFVKHAEDARANALETEALQSQDRADAERYRWIRDEAGLMVLPYDDHGMGPEFPCGNDLDKAIDHARSVEGEGK